MGLAETSASKEKAGCGYETFYQLFVLYFCPGRSVWRAPVAKVCSTISSSFLPPSPDSLSKVKASECSR